jgi:ParB family chromosome partitioning protein
LTLPDDVQSMIRNGQLSAGHARALITSDNASELAKKVLGGGLSVRATENLVKQQARGDMPRKPRSDTQRVEKDADTRALESDLSAALGLKVSIDHKPGEEAGRLTVSYDTLDQLDDLCGRLSR